MGSTYGPAWCMYTGIILPMYKGKCDKCECSNLRGISLFNVVGKVEYTGKKT